MAENASQRRGVMRTKKISVYGRQLKEKQELKKIYGLRESQLKKIVERARRIKGNASTNLLILLESRLDSVVFRMGFAKTRSHARQLVSHGHFLLNNKRVTIPSQVVKVGDIIEPIKKELFKEVEDRKVAWLLLDRSKLIGRVKRLPQREEIDLPLDETLVLQFYSR